MKTLSLVIPVYNEQNTLDKIVEKTLLIEKDEFMLKNDIKLELVLVDDFSSDDSFEIAKKLAKKYQNILIFRQEKNQGKGAALKKGFELAKGDYIGIQDADFEYNPFDYIKMLKPILEDEADIEYIGMTNIGNNPTVADGLSKVIETNIFDFKKDVYGRQVKVFIMKYVRSEKKFTSIEELKNQISKDKELINKE